jgi:hypothetical protein
MRGVRVAGVVLVAVGVLGAGCSASGTKEPVPAGIVEVKVLNAAGTLVRVTALGEPCHVPDEVEVVENDRSVGLTMTGIRGDDCDDDDGAEAELVEDVQLEVPLGEREVIDLNCPVEPPRRGPCSEPVRVLPERAVTPAPTPTP